MTTKEHAARSASAAVEVALLLAMGSVLWPISSASAEDLKSELKGYAHRIVYETYREDNWELYTASADGSDHANLTRTPGVNELNPHVSPDGTKITFVVDEGEGSSKHRHVYLMNMDGTGRTLVARDARQQCWKADGTAIAYLKPESEEFSYTDYATKGVFIHDLAGGSHRQHPNEGLYHLYNLCWSPDGNWFLATVHAGMGYRHAILAIEAEGTKVYNLEIPGCRPDVSPDGKRVAWGASDWALCVADLDLTGPQPKVVNARDVVTSKEPMEIYHVDWSPDGKYLAFSRGPKKKIMGQIPELVGVRAEGWDICVADARATNRWMAVTTDGHSNKEPDWVPAAKEGR